MGIFGKVTETVAKVGFAEQMAAIKSAFKIAHENANNLHAEMESEIAKKESQIAALQEDIKTISVTKQEAETFMSNIEKLI
jgi:lipid II:glycine glycyltransferase (peptidoglycan interpeptide bridge formation enzyme)